MLPRVQQPACEVASESHTVDTSQSKASTAVANHTDKTLADTFQRLMRRYGGVTPDAFEAVLSPVLVPIASLDKKIFKANGEQHYRASFSLKVDATNDSLLVRGRTGKFVPASYGDGGSWREIAKGRIISVDTTAKVAQGEIYVGGSKSDLEEAVDAMDASCLLEIDQFGASAKVLSGLSEHALVQHATQRGFRVWRMPEDMAKHLGKYKNYDFEMAKGGKQKSIELKSIWGTDTRFARLIHSKSTKKPSGPEKNWTAEERANYYPTSSCKFATQDVFAVSLFLRTGHIHDFAFARSVPVSKKRPYGLKTAAAFPEHVHQNPICEVDNVTWFADLDDLWKLL